MRRGGGRGGSLMADGIVDVEAEEKSEQNDGCGERGGGEDGKADGGWDSECRGGGERGRS